MKENIRLFGISGYVHFYRSLLRFFPYVSSGHAADLTFALNSANLESFRFARPNIITFETDKAMFIEKLQRKRNTRPYRTIIQMYRSMEALLFNIDFDNDNLRLYHINAATELLQLMKDLRKRFFYDYGDDIDCEDTVYGLCNHHLIPDKDEPGEEMIEDWINRLTIR